MWLRALAIEATCPVGVCVTTVAWLRGSVIVIVRAPLLYARLVVAIGVVMLVSRLNFPAPAVS